MRKIWLTVFVSIFTLLLTSCSGENDSTTTTQTTQKNKSNVSENTSKTKEEDKKDKAKENQESEVNQTANRDIPGLIAPTNPDRRRQEISKGRRDPFALIPLKSTRSVTIKPDSSVKQPEPPNLSTDDNNQQTNKTKMADLAEEVIVTGVVTVSGSTEIILKVPNEQFSRYVRLGQYVSNGKVLVKQVKFDSDPPVVILEESGIEVLKQVGQGA